MRRTRKWAYVAQEARRLADLGLSHLDIADRLDVHRTTVKRWMAAGKLRDTSGTGPDRPVMSGAPSSHCAGAEMWAAAVRAAYALDATDEQLVDLATSALAVAKNPLEEAGVRLMATGRFQGLVKQLALVARTPATEAPPPEPEPVRPARGPRADPRGQLMLQ